MRYKTISVEEIFPVDVPFLKKVIRKTGTDMDGYLQSLIAAATKKAQDFTGRQIVRAEIMAYSKYSCGVGFEIERGPVKEITRVEIVNADNSVTTLVEADYTVIPEELSAFVIIESSDKLTTASRTRPDAIQITYIAGWTGEEDSLFPEDIVNAVAMSAARMYTNPDDSIDERNSISDNLLRSYRCPIV